MNTTALNRFLADQSQTLALGNELARGLTPGMVLYLSGPLGAGKTTLVRGTLRGLGVTERVKSPTFSLVEPYIVSSLYLYHFDFYRFVHPMEWETAGLREYFDGRAICLIEWPEKASGLPPADLRLEFEMAGEGRAITLRAETPAGEQCLKTLHA